MPTYEYECSSCRHAWELFQSIKADPERKCPRCGRMTARRKIGMGAAILSGGRSAEPQEAPSAVAPSASAGATGSTGATGASPAKDGSKPASEGSKPASADAKPAPAPPTTPAAERGTLNSTHPARDGRGAGNLRDAIRRQRGEPRGTAPKGDARAAAKPAARAPAKPSANRASGARRGGRSR